MKAITMISKINFAWFLLSIASVGLAPISSFAQDDSGRKQADEHLQSELDKIDNLFLKTSETSAGNKMWIIMWEDSGETTKIAIELRDLGKYDHKPIYGLLAYASVVETESPVPPAVIKAIATKNERTGLGHFSSDEAFQTIYINSTAPCDTLTAGQLWIIFAYIHQNRIEFKGEISQLMAGSK